MIQKIIGLLASLAIIALIVFVALGRGSYKSMLPMDRPLVANEATSHVAADSLSSDAVSEALVDSTAVDSLTTALVPSQE